MAVYSDQYNYIFFANPNTASKAIAKTLKEKLDGKRIPGKEIRDAAGKVVVRAHHCTYAQLVDAGLMTAEKLDGLFKFTGVRNPFDQMVSKYVKHCDRLHNEPANYRWSPSHVKAEGAESIEADDADDGDDEDVKPAPKTKAKAKPAEKTAAQTAAGKAKKATKAAAASGPAVASAAAPDAQMTDLQVDFLNWLRHMEMKYEKVDKLEKGPLDFLERADYVIRFESLKEGFAEVVKRIGAPEPVEIVEFNITKAREVAPKKKKSYQDYYTAESQALVAKMFAPVIERFGYQF